MYAASGGKRHFVLSSCRPASPLNWLQSINSALKTNAQDKAAESFLCQLWRGDSTARAGHGQTDPSSICTIFACLRCGSRGYKIEMPVSGGMVQAERAKGRMALSAPWHRIMEL